MSNKISDSFISEAGSLLPNKSLLRAYNSETISLKSELNCLVFLYYS